LVPKFFEHHRLKLVLTDAHRVFTRSTAEVLRASIRGMPSLASSDHDQIGSTFTTLQESAQQIGTGSRPSDETFRGAGARKLLVRPLNALLDLLPKLIGDNSQLRGRYDLPFVFGTRAADASVCSWYFYFLTFVRHDFAG